MKLKKQNDLVAVLEHDGIKIGHVEKLFNGYTVEVMYTRTHFNKEQKHLILDFAERLYNRMKARQYRELIPLNASKNKTIID